MCVCFASPEANVQIWHSSAGVEDLRSYADTDFSV